ncbi:MAG: zinc ribbon domain-containing protein [Actinobacteria bacterium]|nr:zinc ribbon domain-containing protein [Actinomycetota bacterium]MBU1942192.1 zinc ribbon domain-containing protein [Actinomycetota bacterium]MBU2688043.1 zinc ribbon domain-containing protein [Actinomycetota bacterium]
MNCPRCGAENPRNAAFCSLCSQSFAGAPGVVAPPENTAGMAAGPPAAGGMPSSQWTVGPPPSQWGGGPPPPAAPARKSGVGGVPASVQAVVVLVVTALGFLGGYWLVGRVLNSPETYDSAKTALTFKYPGGMKKTSMSIPISYEALVSGSQAQVNDETALEDSKSVLWAGSISGLTPEQWVQGMSNLRASAAEMGSAVAAQGATVTVPASVKDVTIGGKSGLQLSLTMSKMGESVELYLAAFYDGTTAYIIAYGGLPGGGTKAGWKKISESVELR